MRKKSLWVRLSWVRHLATALVVLLAGLYEAADEYNFAPDAKWVHSDEAHFKVLAAAAIIAFGMSIVDAAVEYWGPVGESRRIDIYLPILTALVRISEKTGIDVNDLGGNVFLVKRRFRWKNGWWKQELTRVERVRLADYPQEGDVVWTRGKGAIGKCWDANHKVYKNWKPIATRWGPKDEITEALWGTIPDDHRYGFDRTDFAAMRDKYAEVIAVPIRQGGAFIGCVAVDRVFNKEHSRGVFLNTDFVERTITTAAVVLQNVFTAREPRSHEAYAVRGTA